jgi:hypothetical protein
MQNRSERAGIDPMNRELERRSRRLAGVPPTPRRNRGEELITPLGRPVPPNPPREILRGLGAPLGASDSEDSVDGREIQLRPSELLMRAPNVTHRGELQGTNRQLIPSGSAAADFVYDMTVLERRRDDSRDMWLRDLNSTSHLMRPQGTVKTYNPRQNKFIVLSPSLSRPG